MQILVLRIMALATVRAREDRPIGYVPAATGFQRDAAARHPRKGWKRGWPIPDMFSAGPLHLIGEAFDLTMGRKIQPTTTRGSNSPRGVKVLTN